jgi:hypothetical protein
MFSSVIKSVNGSCNKKVINDNKECLNKVNNNNFNINTQSEFK